MKKRNLVRHKDFLSRNQTFQNQNVKPLKENSRKSEEEKITNRHVTISERVELINQSGTGSNIFDIKSIKASYDTRLQPKETVYNYVRIVCISEKVQKSL